MTPAAKHVRLRRIDEPQPGQKVWRVVTETGDDVDDRTDMLDCAGCSKTLWGIPADSTTDAAWHCEMCGTYGVLP